MEVEYQKMFDPIIGETNCAKDESIIGDGC